MSDPLRSYRLHLQSAGKAPKTIKVYLGALSGVISHAQKTDPKDLTTDDCRSYIAHRLAAGISPTTVSIEARALAVWAKWNAQEYDLPNVMAKVTKPKQTVKVTRVLTDEEVGELLDIPKPKQHRFWRSWVRDQALIAFMLDTGCRLGEVTSLTVGHLDLDRGTALVTGKTGTRTVAFGHQTAVRLDRWLNASDGQEGPLFGLSESGVAQSLARASQAVLGRRVNPHAFRHRWVHSMAAGGMTDTNVATLAGWTTTKMLTTVYATATKQERALLAYQSPIDKRRSR